METQRHLTSGRADGGAVWNLKCRRRSPSRSHIMIRTIFARISIAASISMFISSASAALPCSHNVTEIKFEIYPTRGPNQTCLVLRSNGDVFFVGQRAGRSGYFKGRIPTSEFDAATCEMIDSGFFSLPNEFANHGVHDASTERISAIRGNRSSSVEIYAMDEPAPFHQTAAALRKIIDAMGWNSPRPYSKLADSVLTRFQSVFAVKTNNGVTRYGAAMDHGDVYFTGDRDRSDGRILYESISPKRIRVAISGKKFEIAVSSRPTQCAFH